MLSRIPSVWDARRCANGSNDSDLRIRRCIAKRILRLSRLCSMLDLSIMAAQRSETLTKQFSCGLTAWQILARVPKRSRHPNKFVEKFVHASGVSRIGNFARSGIEKPPRGTEINIRENRDQSQLPHHRHQTLDHARAAEWTRRHTANANGFMDVFLQVCVEHVFQQTGETVIVFGNNENESVGPRHHG